MASGPTWWRRPPLLLVLSLLVFDQVLSRPARADEPPATADVTAYFWTAPNRAHLLLRVPLSGLPHVQLPRHDSGHLALDKVGPALRETAQALAAAIDFYQGDDRLGAPEVRAARISLPLDRGFDSYASALSLVTGPPLPPGTEVIGQQGFADFWWSYQVATDASGVFSAQFRLTPLAPTVTTSLHIAESRGGWADYRFDNDVGRIWFEPSTMRAAWTFAGLGARHAVRQPGMLLLLAGLVLGGPPWVGLGRSVAAGAAALFGSLLTLTGVAATAWQVSGLYVLLGVAILVVALQNLGRVTAAGRTWIVGAAGLLLGIRFAAVLDPLLQYAGAHIAVATVAFGIGVQVAGLLMLAALVAVGMLIAQWRGSAVPV